MTSLLYILAAESVTSNLVESKKPPVNAPSILGSLECLAPLIFERCNLVPLSIGALGVNYIIAAQVCKS